MYQESYTVCFSIWYIQPSHTYLTMHIFSLKHCAWDKERSLFNKKNLFNNCYQLTCRLQTKIYTSSLVVKCPFAKCELQNKAKNTIQFSWATCLVVWIINFFCPCLVACSLQGDFRHKSSFVIWGRGDVEGLHAEWWTWHVGLNSTLSDHGVATAHSPRTQRDWNPTIQICQRWRDSTGQQCAPQSHL